MITEPIPTLTCYSFGYDREDGTFAILATLNNNDGHLLPSQFRAMADTMASALALYTGDIITILERQDVPDYVNLLE
jgi:hypothetical protein